MFQEILTEQMIIMIVGGIMSLVGLGITGLSIRAAQYFGMKRDNEWIAKEQQWKDLLHETMERAARNAVGKLSMAGSPKAKAQEALPSILAQVQASIPGTLKNLKTDVNSKAVKDIAETYAMEVARRLENSIY